MGFPLSVPVPLKSPRLFSLSAAEKEPERSHWAAAETGSTEKSRKAHRTNEKNRFKRSTPIISFRRVRETPWVIPDSAPNLMLKKQYTSIIADIGVDV
jgi:hypothetical protein